MRRVDRIVYHELAERVLIIFEDGEDVEVDMGAVELLEELGEFFDVPVYESRDYPFEGW